MAKKKPKPMNSTAPRSQDRHKARKSVSVHPALHAQMKQLARRHDRPVQWEFRRAIAEYLQKNGITPAMPDDEELAEES